MLDLLEEQSYTQLMIGFLSGFLDFIALLPFWLQTGQSSDPLVEGVLDVDQEVEIVLFDFGPVL